MNANEDAGHDGEASSRVGVYPGSFDPLTIAHLAIAEAALEHLSLDRVDLAISRDALGKPHLDDASVARRVRAIEEVTAGRAELAVVVVQPSLIAEIAADYDAVVMGADKWAQVNDPAWYGDDPTARDAALAALPRLAVAPRSGIAVPSNLRLPMPAGLDRVSSSAVRAGRADWAAG